MGEKGRRDEPSLELPSWRRRRKPAQQAASPVEQPVEQSVPGPVERPVDQPPRERRLLTLPGLDGGAAALLTGAVVGVLTVLATHTSLRLCDVATGTPSCGRPGLLLLAALLVVLAYLGGGLLRRFGVEAPGSTSFLAVGLLAVVAMLVLVDVLFAWWMVLVIPLVSMATYALAWWVTTTAAEPQ